MPAAETCPVTWAIGLDQFGCELEAGHDGHHLAHAEEE